MNKKSLISLTAGIFTLFACSDSVVETDGGNPIQTKAKLTVVVRDATDGNQLTDALVTFPGIKGKKDKTSGTYTFDNVTVGNYEITVAGAAGSTYAERKATVGIGAEVDQNVHIAQRNTETVKLYKKEASLKGHVFYVNKNGKEVAAKDVKVQLHFENYDGDNCALVERIYEADAVTDANGEYTFTKLPAIANEEEGCRYQLYAIGGTVGDEGIVFQTKKLGSTGFDLSSRTESNYAGKTVIDTDDNTEVFVVTSYPAVIEEADRGEPVVFTFSAPIDEKKWTAGTVSIDNNDAYQVTWGANSVTLTPAGKWTSSFTVTLDEGTLVSKTGKTLGQEDFYILVKQVDIRAEEITVVHNDWYYELASDIVDYTEDGLTATDVDYSTGGVQLVWNKVEGADGYVVYRQTGNESNYSVYDSYGKDDTVQTVSVDVTGGKTVKFLVQAFNDQYVTEMSNVVTVKDNIAPVYDLTGNNKNVLYSDYDLTSEFTVAVDADYRYGQLECITFVEPMKKVKPTIELTTGRVVLDAYWSDSYNLCIDAIIKKGAIISATTSSPFTISGLTDEAGNALVIDYDDADTDIFNFKVTLK